MSFWIKSITISPQVGSGDVVIDSLHLDSQHSPGTAQEEDSRGLEVYLGTDDLYEITHYNEIHHTALRTFMLGEKIVDVTFEDAQGNLVTNMGFSVIVWKVETFQTRDKTDYKLRLKRTFI